MIKLFTEEEFLNAKSDDFLPLQCKYCNKVFFALKKKIKYNIKKGNIKNNRFCSDLCRNLYTKKTFEVVCLNCGKKFYKQATNYKKTHNHFCCQSCAAKYNNKHKKCGIRISKLEIFIQNNLTKIFPNIDILFNDKTTINSELDIYIPSLKIAFEINGIFHYEPIHGDKKFKQIQDNDNEKLLKCINKDIKLFVINTSNQKRFTENSSQEFLKFIIQIINDNS